jgi:uncharacterized membrane protein YgcG
LTLPENLPKPTGWVNDFENIFTVAQEQTLNSLITEYEKETTIEISVITIPVSATEMERIDELTLFIANKWGIGKKEKNNGILIGISKGYRKIRINNGLGIEKRITDHQTKEIIERIMIPSFKADDYYKGLFDGIQAIKQIFDKNMNFKFAEQINPDLEQLNFDKAISIAETALRKLPKSDFHYILGKSLVAQADDLATWAEKFYTLATKNNTVAALYFEMNEFDINTDHWYIDSFAFSEDGGLDPDDMEWLCDFDTDSQTEMETVFQINGYEPLQDAFEHTTLDSDDLQNSRDWCEQIIIARFMQLVTTAHTIAKTKKLNWATIPIYFTEHAYDFIVKSDK